MLLSRMPSFACKKKSTTNLRRPPGVRGGTGSSLKHIADIHTCVYIYIYIIYIYIYICVSALKCAALLDLPAGALRRRFASPALQPGSPGNQRLLLCWLLLFWLLLFGLLLFWLLLFGCGCCVGCCLLWLLQLQHIADVYFSVLKHVLCLLSLKHC